MATALFFDSILDPFGLFEQDDQLLKASPKVDIDNLNTESEHEAEMNMEYFDDLGLVENDCMWSSTNLLETDSNRKRDSSLNLNEYIDHLDTNKLDDFSEITSLEVSIMPTKEYLPMPTLNNFELLDKHDEENIGGLDLGKVVLLVNHMHLIFAS